MNYKFETIMTWIMYVRNGIWEIDNHGKYKPDASTIRDKFEALFLNELFMITVSKVLTAAFITCIQILIKIIRLH